MHTSVQITALQQLLKELWLKARKVGLVFKVADVSLWHRWAVPQPSPPQHRTSLCVTAGQQPQSHLTGQEDSQHIPTLSLTLSTNREVFLLKPLQTRAAPYSLILDLCRAAALCSRCGVRAWSSFSCGMWAVPEPSICCWGCFCVAAAEQMILDLILCLPGQNYPIKIFWTNLKQCYGLAPVLHLVMCGFSSSSWLLEAAEPS